jgi:hydroxymethylbilane synthase
MRVTDQIRTIRLGTRGSALARWQTDHIAALLREAHPGLRTKIAVFTTRGDQVLDVPLPKVGGKGLFTAELEEALRSSVIDLAVHSLKDLPTEDPDGLAVGAIPTRAAANDVLISRERHTLDMLPEGAVIGSSSHRRAGQLLYSRPYVRIADIRGNVDTRVRKALDPSGPYDAILLARAGLERLGYSDVISEVLPFQVMLPAPVKARGGAVPR